MTIERGFRARFRYRSDEFLSSGAGNQLLFLFGLSIGIVLFHVLLAVIAGAAGAETGSGDGFFQKFWFYFTRILDAGTMGGDEGVWGRIISTFDTIAGVVVAGLLISALAGNFQDRLEAIKRGGSPVQETGHFLILGWSEKIYSVIDQLSEANVDKGRITVVIMAEREKIDMESRLRDKVVHLDRVKLVVRSGSSVSLVDLSKVAYERAQAIVVLVDEADVDASKADGRIIKTLMAIYNHPDGGKEALGIKVTAEVMRAVSREIAEIASDGHAQVIATNDIISKIILQTARISGLSSVYDELLRFEGNEIHYAKFPQLVGRRFGDLLLEFPNGLIVGVAKMDGSSHQINPPLDHQVQPDEELLILAEDPGIIHQAYQGPLRMAQMPDPTPASGSKQVEHLLVLGWNQKLFPILTELDNYVGSGSSVTLISTMPVDQRDQLIADQVGEMKNVTLRHTVGEFTSRSLMEYINPHLYPTVMVLGDATDASGDAEDSDTRALIALLLLRDFRRRHNVAHQEVCSEILNPKNRELAATTETNDIVISNEMVSMVIAQVTNEPRVRPVLEDLFRSEGSEIYLKSIGFYAAPGSPITFEQLVLIAAKRGELALGYQQGSEPGTKPEKLILNPKDRSHPVAFRPGARLVVLAEDDG